MRLVGSGYHRTLDFNEKKRRHGITETIPFDDDGERILSNIEAATPLRAAEIEWLRAHDARSVFGLLEKQFSRLQQKYKAVVPHGSDVDRYLLLRILQSLDENRTVDQPDTRYLHENGFVETIEIIQQLEFSALKEKYRATAIQDNNISHHLYKVLIKLDSGIAMPEPDINYLKKRKLHQTVKFAFKKEADCLIGKIKKGHDLTEDDVAWCEIHDFEEIVFLRLRKEYCIADRSYTPTLYAILKKAGCWASLE